jgi:hypothetical protein
MAVGHFVQQIRKVPKWLEVTGTRMVYVALASNVLQEAFFSSLSFVIPHNLFQYLTIICSLKNAKGSLTTSP